MRLKELKLRPPSPRAAELVRTPEQPGTSWFDPELELSREDRVRVVAEIVGEASTRTRLYYSFELFTIFPELAGSLQLEELKTMFTQVVEEDEGGMSKFQELEYRAIFGEHGPDPSPYPGGVFEIPDRAACSLLTDNPYVEQDKAWVREEFERRYPLQPDGSAGQVSFQRLTPDRQNALAWFKIAFPQSFSQRVIIADTDEVLKRLRQDVDRARRGRMEWSTVLWSAFQMAALSAEDIEYTATGQLKFIQPRKAMVQTPQLPDRPQV